VVTGPSARDDAGHPVGAPDRMLFPPPAQAPVGGTGPDSPLFPDGGPASGARHPSFPQPEDPGMPSAEPLPDRSCAPGPSRRLLFDGEIPDRGRTRPGGPSRRIEATAGTFPPTTISPHESSPPPTGPPRGPRPPGAPETAAPTGSAGAASAGRSSPGTGRATPAVRHPAAGTAAWWRHTVLRRDEVTGVVSGAVLRDLRSVAPPAGGPLLALLAVVFVLAAVNALRGSALPGLVGTGLGAAVVGLFLVGLLLGQVIGAGTSGGLRLGGSLAGVLVRAVTGLLGLVLGVVGRLLQTGAGPGRLRRSPGAGRGSGAGTEPVAVRRFRVLTADGRTRVCVMHGDLDGDDLREGDAVHVVGHRGRQDVLAVHQVEVLSGTGGLVLSRLRPRAPADVLAAQWTRVLARVGTTVLLVLAGQQLWTLLH
jgi:hypothetical protein